MSLLKRKRLLKASAVAEMRGCSVTSLKRYAADPADDFPKPIIDQGHMKWVEGEVTAWLAGREAERDEQWQGIHEVFQKAG